MDNIGKNHKLLKQIGRTGGEGSVYITDTNYICKIYKKDKVTLFRQEKILKLIQNDIKVKNVCLPEFIVYNKQKEFIGYLMPKAEGHEIKTSIFIPPLFKQKFSHWNRLHLAKVAFNILKKVEQLHTYNIILGDINPSNILIKNENNIFFIDTDSFQIEEYPCSVGMVAYTRKERHGKRYDEYLRNKDDDIFAVSVLIFQLMLPGKLPYSFSGGGSEKENMNPKNFPYKCYDGDGYTNAPDGQWVYIWSHLPKKLKLLFCRIFKKNEKILLHELVTEIKNYIYQLEKGFQSTDIFPLTHKQIDNKGNVLKDDFQELNCVICGSSFAIPNKQVEQLKIKGWNLPTKCDICKKIPDPDLKKCNQCGKKFKDKFNNLCKNCRGRDITCSICYNIFRFTDGEKEFYDKKGLTYPKKCKKCRNDKSTSSTAYSNTSNSILGSLWGWLK
jgi:serine/threonine protein kinase